MGLIYVDVEINGRAKKNKVPDVTLSTQLEYCVM